MNKSILTLTIGNKSFYSTIQIGNPRDAKTKT